jgi:DNA primase
MDISEQVLISTLAQLLQKSTTEVGKNRKEYNTLEIVKVKILLQKS